VISARNALRFLANPRQNCKPAFFVLVKETSSADVMSDAASVSAELQSHKQHMDNSLKEYQTVFETQLLVSISARPLNAPAQILKAHSRTAHFFHSRFQIGDLFCLVWCNTVANLH
jgi:hypothetical protein